MPKLKLSDWVDRKIKKRLDKFYNGLSEIEIKLDGRILFRGHKDDSVVMGIVRANPGASVEWVDKTNTSEIILRGIK